MTPNIDQHPIAPEHFKASFGVITPLILEEWPQLTADRLAATAGDLNQVVDYIAAETDRTRILIRRQLQELYQIALANQPPAASSRLATRLTELTTEALTDSHFKATIAELEARTEKLLHQFKQETLPDLTEQVKKNPVGSLLAAVGVGFVLGLVFGGGRGR